MTADTPYAEVIGDPVSQSKSPLIHRRWLAELGLPGDYRRTLVTAPELCSFLEQRRSDRHWLGCNVTIPHKERVIPCLDRLDHGARRIGAVNCIVPQESRLVGYNTDIDGIAAALDAVEMAGRPAVMIGAGGAARAAAAYLSGRGVSCVHILVRDPKKAETLQELLSPVEVEIAPLSSGAIVPRSPAVVINATPLGMAGKPPLPAQLLHQLRSNASGALFFDMVYEPLETAFLRAGRLGGAQVTDGLTMLIGQARRAFELFFGARAPFIDQTIRDLLVT